MKTVHLLAKTEAFSAVKFESVLDRQLIRQHPDDVRQRSLRKGLQAPVDEFLATDERWRGVTTELSQAQAQMNQIAKSIGALMAQGKRDEAEQAKAQTADLKAKIKDLETQERELEDELKAIELQFPNLPHDSVPDGADESANVEVRRWGTMDETLRESAYDLAVRLGLVDFERGAKISGSGFVVYTGYGARLQRALFNWMVDFQVERHGYHEIYPPYLVNRDSLIGTGNLPKFEEDLYGTTDDLFLIPTAEVPVTNLYRDEILDAEQLPIRLAAYSACFRREAGAAGKETRGILRMHQFDKVELVHFVRPEESYAVLEELTNHAEAVLQALKLPYRVIELCAGDMGDKGAKTYDVEVWSPGEQRFLEVSSCTNFEAFQSRRARIRFRPDVKAKPEFVHILNGSGIAVPRLLVALLETCANEKGGVTIPAPLHPYTGFTEIPAS